MVTSPKCTSIALHTSVLEKSTLANFFCTQILEAHRNQKHGIILSSYVQFPASLQGFCTKYGDPSNLFYYILHVRLHGGPNSNTTFNNFTLHPMRMTGTRIYYYL